MDLLRRIRPKSKAWLGAACAAVVVILAVGVMLLGGSSSSADETTVAQADDLPPAPWEAPATESGPEVAEAPNPDIYGDPPPATKPGEMPAASAGSNGSYTPTPASERKRMSAIQHPDGGAGAAFLLGDTALPPANAPEEIQAAISAANQLVHQPYVWGGGHASFQSRGYDCSGAVSYALAGAGLLGAPATSGQLMGWGEPGRGRWLTVYANPGHTYAVIAGLRWDTVGNARGSGPRWHPADAYPSGFQARHIPGL